MNNDTTKNAEILLDVEYKIFNASFYNCVKDAFNCCCLENKKEYYISTFYKIRKIAYLVIVYLLIIFSIPLIFKNDGIVIDPVYSISFLLIGVISLIPLILMYEKSVFVLYMIIKKILSEHNKLKDDYSLLYTNIYQTILDIETKTKEQKEK